MTRPQETERHFQDLLDLLSVPIPAGHRMVAIAQFLRELGPPVSADSYLVEIAERILPFRNASDLFGIDPLTLEQSLRTVGEHLASSPSLAGSETIIACVSTFPHALALSCWMAGEHARALLALGLNSDLIPEGIETLAPSGSPEALAQASRMLAGAEGHDGAALASIAEWLENKPAHDEVSIPVVERVPGPGWEMHALRGTLRRVAVGALDWSAGHQDEVEANTALVGFDGDWGSLLRAPLSAARLLVQEHGRRAPECGARLHLVFERPGAFHEGKSANLAFAALLFCRLLRATGAREEFSLRPGSAITGVIDQDGSVLAVEAEYLSSKVEAAFFSPVPQLVVPARQLDAARGALQALQERYPRRRLTLVGIEHLRELFFDRRLTGRRRISVPHLIGRAVWHGRRPITAGLVIILVAALAASWIGPLDRDPVSAIFRGEMLVLQNRSGQDLREIHVGRQTVEHAGDISAGEVERALVNLFDVDGDGIKEVLYILHPEKGSNDPDALVCLWTAGDTPRWKFEGRFVLSFPHKTDIVSDAFRIEEIWTGDCDGDGRPEVLLLANHVFYPSVIARLDATTGALQQQYVHIGTLGDLAIVDLERDGNVEILACGTNNALNMACLVVLDPRSLNGHSPTAGAYVMDDRERASERVYVVIPRTAVGRVFANQYDRNGAINLEIEPEGKRFCVRVQDAGGLVEIGSVELTPLLFYYFGFDLVAQQVATSTEFDIAARLLWEHGLLSEAPDEKLLKAAQRGVRYLHGDGSFGNQPPVLHEMHRGSTLSPPGAQ